MSQFIIEMGSANEHHNDIGYLREMIDAVVDCDTGKHSIVFKHQLFEHAGKNEPLLWRTFAWAHGYASELGYETTASVFDVVSREFLCGYDVPFIKIACRPKLYHLVYGGHPGNRFIVSYYESAHLPKVGDTADRVGGWLACVPKYPATLGEYESKFTAPELERGISDHTIGWRLFHAYAPVRIEKHFCLKRSYENPDSGPFAVTPDELREVL